MQCRVRSGPSPSTTLSSNVQLTQLLNYRQALRNVQNGVSDAKLLFLGDSTTAGFNSGNVNFPILGAPSTKIISPLNYKNYPMAQGLGIPPSGNPQVDNRWVADSNWGHFTFGFGGNADWQNSSGTVGTGLNYTPTGGLSYDSFDIYYIQSPGLGTFTATATGGVPTPVNAGSGPNAVVKTTVTGTLSTTISLNIITTPGFPNHILGVEPFNSTVKRIRVGNAGTNMAQSGDYVLNSTSFGAIPCIKTYAPHLTIWNIGINDSTIPISVATYSSNVQQIILACQVSGDVILQTCFPSTNSSWHATQALYRSALFNLASSMNVGIIDYWGSINGVQPPAFLGDGVHPNPQGYLDAASQDYNAIAV